MERPIPTLSAREAELLKFAAEGLTDTAIAHRLGISEATVGTYWGRVRIKLGPYNRTELVAIILRAQQEEEVRKLREEYSAVVEELRRETLGGKRHYRQLLENVPDALLLVSDIGTIDYANPVAHELFGYSEGELNGRSLLCLIPERFKARHTEHREEYVNNPSRREMGQHLETPALRKDGQEIPVRATLSAVETREGLLVTCVVRPIKPS